MTNVVQGVPIDWSKPIEAVHEDGRVVSVSVERKSPYPHDAQPYLVKPRLDRNTYWFCEDGSHLDEPWHIRNVADTDTVTVKRLSRVDIDEARKAYFAGAQPTENSAYFFAQRWGLIKPDPTPADRFKSAHPEWELLDRSDLVDKVLAWKGAQ